MNVDMMIMMAVALVLGLAIGYMVGLIDAGECDDCPKMDEGYDDGYDGGDCDD